MGSSVETPSEFRHVGTRNSSPERRKAATLAASGPMRKSIGTASAMVPGGSSRSQGSPMHHEASAVMEAEFRGAICGGRLGAARSKKRVEKWWRRNRFGWRELKRCLVAK